MGGYGLIHTLLAGERPRLWARRRMGAAGRRWYRLAYNLLAGLALLLILLLMRSLPDAVIYRIPMPWVLVSMGLQGVAILSMLLVVHETGILTFIGLVSEEDQPPQLVTNGLYRWVRHPLYTGGLLIIWLASTMTWNLLALCIGATAYILIGIHFEERKLLREYGKKYADYRRRTSMLVPGLKSLKKRQ
jgi:methanethiol S-methyltransferase